MEDGAATRAMEGRCYQYCSSPAPLQAFESGPPAGSDRFLVVMGGLTDGLLPTAYTPPLAAAVAAEGWSTVQPLLRGSYCQFGTGGLDNDVEDLSSLVSFLRDHRGAKHIALLGHSTGCQISVRFLATDGTGAAEELRAMVVLAVLQAPVSDREAGPLAGVGPEVITEARALADAGKGSSIISHALYGFIPLSAQRALDLFDRLGADDMFSSDLSESELAARLGHLGGSGAHVLLALSMKDQYVPLLSAEGGAQAYTELGKRLLAAVTAGGGGDVQGDFPDKASLLLIDGADHPLSGPHETAGGAQLVQAVVERIRSCVDAAAQPK
jgi:pimeloyl-ACP methyl ester carboxylesterase